MLYVLDGPHAVEYSVELGYGIIYFILSILSFKKSREMKNSLAKFFGFAFLCLSLSGVYGGIAGFVNALGDPTLPVIGEKINELYDGLAVLSLGFFIAGLIKVK